MAKIVSRLLSGPFYGIAGTDPAAFREALRKLLGMINPSQSFFAADSMIVWKRSLLFLQDERLTESVEKYSKKPGENKGFTWRFNTLLWAAKQALHVDGDFVECGVYEGTSMAVVTDYLDFGVTGRKLYLYDCFGHEEGDKHLKLAGHGSDLLKTVEDRFGAQPWAHIVKGYVPASFNQALPEKVAFAHIDMNDAAAEIGALEALWPRLQPGAVIVLDDYGSDGLEAQRRAHDEFFGRYGIPIMETATVQGIVVIPPGPTTGRGHAP